MHSGARVHSCQRSDDGSGSQCEDGRVRAASAE